ncbi:hypothetical protein [Pseudanabaena sp. SR411]|nr:hypothetical protein [Pseudanabaena sp. SR411]
MLTINKRFANIGDFEIPEIPREAIADVFEFRFRRSRRIQAYLVGGNGLL